MTAAQARNNLDIFTLIPFFLIHGDADKVVPLSHSEKLVAVIRAAGGLAELIVKAGSGYPWLPLPEQVKVIADWFDKQPGQPVASGGSAK